MVVSYRGSFAQGDTLTVRFTTLTSWLTSPKILLSGLQCLEFDVYTPSRFRVMIGYDDSLLLQDNDVIYTSQFGLGLSWHHVSLNLNLSPEPKMYYIVFESRHGLFDHNFGAGLDNIHITSEACSNQGER